MRKSYELFVNQNWNTMCSNLTWSHYREVLSLENINKIIYYVKVVALLPLQAHYPDIPVFFKYK